MAQRGMLPKFRPAAAFGGAARPSIRPVRPGPPPPPPSPPRKVQSGVAARRGEEIISEPEFEGETTAYPEPPTQAAAFQKRQHNFDDETQARPELDAHTARRAQPAEPMHPVLADLSVPFDALPSLAMNRPFDEFDREFVDRDPAAQVRAARESAQMRRAPRVPDPQPTRREHSEGDGVYDKDAYEANEPRYEEQSYEQQSYEQEASYEEAYAPAPPAPPEPRVRRSQQGSGARQRPAHNDYEQAERMIPPPARMPEDAPPGFVMGVQPIRTLEGPMFPPAPGPLGPQHMYTPQPTMGAMGQMNAMAHMASPMTPMQAMQAMQAMPPVQALRPMTPPHGAMALPQRVPTGPVMAAAAYVQSAHKGPSAVHSHASSQTATTAGSKTGRFAWFVFGSAFGIAFAFFATGFAPKIVGGNAQPTHTADPFPPAPAMTAPVATQLPQTPAATAPTMMAPQTLPPAQGQPQFLPSVPQGNPQFSPPPSGTLTNPGPLGAPPASGGTINGQFVPAPPSTGTQATTTAPSRPQSRPAPQRPSRPYRPASPPRAPRGGGDGDDVPTSREDAKSAAPGDILGDALK